MSIRVLIADDHPVVLSGLEAVLHLEPGFELVGKCSDSNTILAAVLKTRPDVVLLDLNMPGKDGLAVLRELHTHAQETRVVLLTGEVTEEQVIEALRLGIRGILLKEMAPRLLLECIRKVHGGGQWLEKESIGRVIEKMLKREEATQHFDSILTRREQEILHLVVKKMTNQEIGTSLFIAPGTVKVHIHSIYKKLAVSGRVELLRWAREKGWT